MKIYIKILFCLSILMILPIICLSCSDSSEPEEVPEKVYIEFDDNKLTFTRLLSSQSIAVKTNVNDIACRVTAAGDWCSATYTNGILSVFVTANSSSGSRTGIISLEGGNIRKTVSVLQNGRSAGDLKDDIKLMVKSGEASSVHSGDGISKTFDGNMSTIYHSDYASNENKTVFPVTLVYNFENIASMDYLVYYPRTVGTNGNIGQLDLYVTTEDNPTRIKYGSYDFQKSSSPSIITFTPALEKPSKIEFVVNSGAGDYVSCAEMVFYKKNPDNFDYTALFADALCSKLKAGVTLAQIEKVENQFFRELALEIFKGHYEADFRIQEYKVWQNPNIQAAINKTGTYSLRDNPTGIYAQQGDEIVVFADNLYNQNIALFIQDPDDKISGSSYPIITGMNKFKATNSGLIYILYHTSTATEPSIKLNIASGTVNGYFDTKKHKKEDWKKMLEKATFRHFDLLGEYAHMTFETDKFRQYTPDGEALVRKFDELVRLEQDFMGLFKYDKAYKNRSYFLVMANSSYMHASSYYTGYDIRTQKDILSLNTFITNTWGVAHEVGHIHQTRPGLKWRGMTEVTNNIHSLYIQTEWGNESRLITENTYDKAFSGIINARIAHNAHPDVFCKLVPFWQLKLYMHDVLGKNDFYKDVYERIRVNPDPATDGACQMEFVKIVCDVAQLDLTDFFDAWGFLKEVIVEIDDHGKNLFVVSQNMVNNCKAYIADKNYLKPKHKVQNITDKNVDTFK